VVTIWTWDLDDDEYIYFIVTMASRRVYNQNTKIIVRFLLHGNASTEDFISRDWWKLRNTSINTADTWAEYRTRDFSHTNLVHCRYDNPFMSRENSLRLCYSTHVLQSRGCSCSSSRQLSPWSAANTSSRPITDGTRRFNWSQRLGTAFLRARLSWVRRE
jgi:hypothetical protein